MSWSAEQPRSTKVSPKSSTRRSLYRLPVFYAEAIFKPTARTFAKTAEYARWPLVGIQLVLLIVIPLLMGLLRGIFGDRSTGVNTHANVLFGFLDLLTVGATLVAVVAKIIIVPVLFFVALSMQYILARALGGRGHYLAQGFDMLLYEVPLAFIGGLIITLIVAFHHSTLYFSPIISVVLFAYGIFINSAVIMGVHGLDRNKSFAVIAIPYIIGLLAICGALAALASYLTKGIL